MKPARHRRMNGWILAGPALAVTLVAGFYFHRQLHAGFGPGLLLDLPLLVALLSAWLVSLAAWRHGFRWFFRRQRLGLYLACLASLASLLILFYCEEAWRGQRAWAAATRELASKGESFGLSTIIPPALPDDENFVAAPIFTALFDTQTLPWGPAGKTHFNNPGPLSELRGIQLPIHEKGYCQRWLRGEFLDLALWQNYFRSNGLAPEVFRAEPAYDVLRALSKFDSLLNQLRAAGRRPGTRFPIDYEQGLLAQNLQLKVLQDLSHVLCLRSVAEVSLGKTAEALDDIRLGFRLAEALKNEPGFLSSQARQEMLLASLQAVWEGLALHRWPPRELRSLQIELGRIDLLSEFDAAWRSEMILWVDLGNKVLAAGTARSGSVLPASAELWMRLYPSGWVRQNQAALYRCYRDLSQAVEPKSQRVRVSAAAAAHRRLREYFGADPAFCLLCLPKLNLMYLTGVPQLAFTQTAINQAALACALESYRLDSGEYPEDLKNLTPEYAGRIPHDLITGMPLKYRRVSTNAFELYSVGWNETDEHGQPGPISFDHRQRDELWKTILEGDWPWIYPSGATPAKP
jgi:hypothetical protein